MQKCRDCKYMAVNYLTSFQGEGLFQFSYCAREIHKPKVVESDIDRECGWFEAKEVVKEG